MKSDWTLTLVEYDENDMPEHETLATCDSRAHMLQAVQRHSEIAYKCYVTETIYGDHEDCYGAGDIAEQSNAQEWMEDELKRYASNAENAAKARQVKHPVKRIPLCNGDFSPDCYEYRGYTLERNDNVPNGYWGRWRVGKYTTDTRRDCIRWVDERIAQKQAASEVA